jgi:vanillate O-demethylase ferredoxin subunit
MNYLSVKVTKKMSEAEDIASFELGSIDGSALPPFSAGSHIDVHITDGLIRQYSLCNASCESHRYLIGVLRDPNSRGGSIAMHNDINEGDIIRISEPKNHFPLVESERSLLFAGGIGITPLLCMAERLAQIGGNFELHYCSRSLRRTAFHRRIAESPFAGRVHFHFDDEDAGQKLDLPALLAAPEQNTHLYLCGPPGFIDHVVHAAKAYGWPVPQVHVEYFGAIVDATARDREFELQIASTGKVYAVPADTTIVTVLGEHGIEIPVSCEQGVCGTCITRVLEGEPEHRDLYFTEAERARNDQLTPCCSRSRSKRLVLDL